jgi:hypothetical protein
VDEQGEKKKPDSNEDEDSTSVYRATPDDQPTKSGKADANGNPREPKSFTRVVTSHRLT